MKPSDFIALDFKLKHAISKKAVIATYPELKEKTIAQVQKLIMVNTMITTGKSIKEQQRNRLIRKKWLLINLYKRKK
jgi:hypothetical protein